MADWSSKHPDGKDLAAAMLELAAQFPPLPKPSLADLARAVRVGKALGVPPKAVLDAEGFDTRMEMERLPVIASPGTKPDEMRLLGRLSMTIKITNL